MTTETDAGRDSAATLACFHAKLVERFSQLKADRASLHAPVFALEHGLDSDAVLSLQAAVQEVVRRGVRPRESWLTFVVYAAEIAYWYDGSEYWQGFDEKTPGWNRTTDHDLLAGWYEQFRDEFGGAVPSGRWAGWFKKISWPITHAVLPVLLQRQLAQLLYEDRGMAGAIQDPNVLGVRLAARASGYSTRFRQFCQNTELLGAVASSLLLGRDETSVLLTESALSRLVRNVESERQARIWLDEARAARRINSKGFMPSGRTASGGSRDRAVRAPNPELFLRRRDGQWEVCVTLPDLRALAGRLPELADALMASKARLLGRNRPLARGRLLDPDQMEALDQWPEVNKPLLALDGCSNQVNTALGDYSLKTPGPWWVFRDVGNGTAVEVRGKALKPGGRYILLTVARPKPPLPWVAPVKIWTEGVSAFRAVVPEESVTEGEESALVDAGLSFLSNAVIRPVGLVAPSWDGQGAVEWIVGESMMLGVSSDRTPTTCHFDIDGVPSTVSWPTGSSELVVDFCGLEVGEHSVELVLQGTDGTSATQGQLAVVVRDTPVRPEAGTVGEGIRLRIDPSRPTLDELWLESTEVLVDGPSGAVVSLEVDLLSEDGASLLERQLSRNATLPVTAEHWHSLADSLRKDPHLAQAYDDAELCVLSVSKAGLGFAKVNAARPFRPLSWRIRKARGRQEASVRLVDQTDSGKTAVGYYAASDPLTPLPWPEESAMPQEGGLVVATSDDIRVSVVLPPDPNWLRGDEWKKLRSRHIYAGSRTLERITQLVDGHYLWDSAELPGDPFAETLRSHVLSGIDNALCYLITDRDWVRSEQESLLDHWDTVTILTSTDDLYRDVARSVGSSLYAWDTKLSLLRGFTQVAHPVFEKYAPNTKTPAWFLVHLADRPGTLSLKRPGTPMWDRAETKRLLNAVLAKPLLYKLARMAVLGAKDMHENWSRP